MKGSAATEFCQVSVLVVGLRRCIGLAAGAVVFYYGTYRDHLALSTGGSGGSLLAVGARQRQGKDRHLQPDNTCNIT